MNLKERGITVGDLLIILIIVITTTILVKTFNKDKKATLSLSDKGEIYYEKTLFSNNHLNNFSF